MSMKRRLIAMEGEHETGGRAGELRSDVSEHTERRGNESGTTGFSERGHCASGGLGRCQVGLSHQRSGHGYPNQRFATVRVDERGKRVRTYRTKDYKTPYKKLKSLPDAVDLLKPGVTFEYLDQVDGKTTDIHQNQGKGIGRYASNCFQFHAHLVQDNSYLRLPGCDMLY